MADESVIREGRAAGELLRSEIFQTVTEAVQASIMAKWASTQPAQVDEREEYYYLLLAFDHLKARMEAMEQNAKLEQDKLDRATPKTNIIDFSQQ